MKIVYIECDAEEMRANRTLIDALTDVAHSIVDALQSPVSEEVKEPTTEEEQEADINLEGIFGCGDEKDEK